MGIKLYQGHEIRCGWVNPADPLYLAYHDQEWGVPEYDSRALWEKLVLDGFQAGLAWITVLRKREAFRQAFAGFDPTVVARFGEADRAGLMANPDIIRSGAKIDSAIRSARIFLDMREAGDDFAGWLWDLAGGAPVQNRWSRVADLPASTPVSVQMARALKDRGFGFCGPVIVYAFMQAVGMVNDHVDQCFRQMQVESLARA